MLFNKLNDSDKILAINKIMNSMGTDLIKNALLSYFAEHIRTGQYLENETFETTKIDLNKLNKTISAIIHMRDDTPSCFVCGKTENMSRCSN